jgi:hypothetical protein
MLLDLAWNLPSIFVWMPTTRPRAPRCYSTFGLSWTAAEREITTKQGLRAETGAIGDLGDCITQLRQHAGEPILLVKHLTEAW